MFWQKQRLLWIAAVSAGLAGLCLPLFLFCRGKEANSSNQVKAVTGQKKSHLLKQIPSPTSPEKQISRSLEEFAKKYSNPEVLAAALGSTDDPTFFLAGTKVLIGQTNRLSFPQRTIIWQMVLDGIKTKGGATYLVGFLQPISDELFPIMEKVSMLGCRSLTDFLVGGSIPSPAEADYYKTESLVSKLANPQYALAWRKNFIARDLENLAPEAAIAGLSAIEDATLRESVEPLLLASLGYSHYKVSAEYFLGSSCVSTGNRSLAMAIFSDYLSSDPEGASLAIRNAPPSDRRDWAIAVMLNQLRGIDQEAEQAWIAEVKTQAVMKSIELDQKRQDAKVAE